MFFIIILIVFFTGTGNAEKSNVSFQFTSSSTPLEENEASGDLETTACQMETDDEESSDGEQASGENKQESVERFVFSATKTVKFLDIV